MKRIPYRVPATRKAHPDQPQEDPSLPPQMREFRKMCNALIKQHGWMVQSVLPPSGNISHGYSYTVGAMGTLGHPELLIAGLPPAQSMLILNKMLSRVRRHGPFETCVRIVGAVLFHEIQRSVDLFAVDLAHELYKPCVPVALDLDGHLGVPIHVLQLYYPDNGGYFPHQAECDTDIKARQEMYPERGGGHGTFSHEQ